VRHSTALPGTIEKVVQTEDEAFLPELISPIPHQNHRGDEVKHAKRFLE
jgi:hypothetical protein